MKPAKRITVTDGLAREFWSMVDKGDGSGCWIWTGHIMPNGYGVVMGHAANRVSFAIHYYDVPGDMHVCHTCDNPKCVRPDHLVPGTPSENNLDCAHKGRNPGNREPEARPTAIKANRFRMQVLELGRQGKLPSEIARELRTTWRRVMKIRDSHTIAEGGNRKYGRQTA